VSGEGREFHYGTVRPGLAEADVQVRVQHPFVHGREIAS
jgi:hypothetical protein